MGARAHVLCPIDFSDPSRAALRYARAIAGHFEARLTVVTVNDPLLTEVAELRMGSSWMAEDAERELRRFVAETFEHSAPSSAEIRFEVAEGKPAPEILRVARERGCDLIVMGTHGMTGVRKMFFGSTTERVLRETGVPVLLTPAAQVGPLTLDDVKRAVRRVLAPVDLSPATAHQVQVASGLAEALDAPLLLLSVIQPVHFPLPAHVSLPSVDAERRTRAEQLLERLVSTMPSRVRTEALVAYGNPAEEIAKTARDRHAGLIVMGLHASPLAGPRMGSVTYRVLCLAPTLVLALPPAVERGAPEVTSAEATQTGGALRSTF
ncbi:MAG TPA: universal stress protein [Vicinamibacterales bacterium]|jgi:nucleotide-binding universal stress UspA family protein|nr:universal stress protein [Vicinamibacterales bacterium]